MLLYEIVFQLLLNETHCLHDLKLSMKVNSQLETDHNWLLILT